MDITKLLFGLTVSSAHVAGHALKERRKQLKNELDRSQTLEYNNKHSSPRWEVVFTEMIEDPDRYNEVWEKLEMERAKKEDAISSFRESINPDFLIEWDFVLGERKPFHTKDGLLAGNNKKENAQLQYNRDMALFLLMRTRGMIPQRIIDMANSRGERVSLNFEPRK